jgi:hypothetical protein
VKYLRISLGLFTKFKTIEMPGYPQSFKTLAISAILTIPLLWLLFPLILRNLQLQYPEKVSTSNPFFILFSPYLDKQGIDNGENPTEILTQALDTGIRPIVRQTTTPVLIPIREFLKITTQAIEGIQETIKNSVNAPVRGMYTLANTFLDQANMIISSFIAVGSKILSSIRGAMDNIVAVILNILYSVMNAKNMILSIFNLFINIGRSVTNIIFIIASLFVIMIFSPASIILGIILFTLGGVLRGLIESIYRTMNIV